MLYLKNEEVTNMKQKKGFTLVEVLVVLGILAILMTLSATSVISIMRKNDDKLKNEMEKNLKEAAIAYMEEKKIILKKCSNNFDPANPNTETSCYKKLTVQELINSGLFTDEAGYCKKEENILIYRANENEYTELRAYVKEGTCD